MRFLDFFRALFRRIARFFQRRSHDIQGSPPQPAGDRYHEAGYADYYDSWVLTEVRVPDPITFTAFRPHDIALGEWTDLLVYIGIPEARAEIFRDSERRLRLSRRNIEQQTIAGRLQRGTEVLVVPEIDDAEINPASARVTWLEPWHHVDFRFRLAPGNPEAREGRIFFYVGPLLVGTLELFLIPGRRGPVNFNIASPYRSIFVSYAHADREIVDRLERAAIAIGDTYLRDTKILRSGEEWSPAVLGHIDDADVFQLCWSEDAKRSQYVEQEWQHAHGLARRNFIRPMYWKKPMPAPPAQLASIHFRYVPFEG